MPVCSKNACIVSSNHSTYDECTLNIIKSKAPGKTLVEANNNLVLLSAAVQYQIPLTQKATTSGELELSSVSPLPYQMNQIPKKQQVHVFHPLGILRQRVVIEIFFPPRYGSYQ